MVLTDKLRRSLTVALAAMLFLASMVPLLTRQTAHAYGLLGSREIKMDSSVAGATGVTYSVSFTLTAATTIKSLVFDFCSNSPIIGDSCTAPAGFSVGTPTVTTFVIGGNSQAGWTFASANTNRTLTFTKAAGYTPAGGGELVTFNLTTATNPSATNTTFYSRLLTFPNDAGADSAATYTATAPGAATDAGGVAMSTAAQITVTAKVQERLTFCVFTVDGTPSDTCGTTTPVSGTAISLGDNNGVLNENEAFVNKAPKFTIYTNASAGAIVRGKATGTLTSGAFSINAIAAGNGSGTTSTPGSEQFGFCEYQSAGTFITTSAPYNDTANCTGTTNTAGNAPGSGGGTNGTTFAFDTTTGGENLSTQYGDVLATVTAGTPSTVTMPFMANIATTTEPGIYTATMTYIATGTY